MKRQLTQQGWDGTFTWAKGVPSPTMSDGDGAGSQLGTFPAPSFDGFNRQDEKGGNGPTMGPTNSNPSDGQFPYNPRGGDTVMGNRRQNE